MSKSLDIYFDEKLVGQLSQDIHGEINFTYAKSWLNDPHAIGISCSLPLQKETFNRKICRPYFNGILPEENPRKIIAKVLGISAANDFSMLEKIGGECAGALTFLPVGEELQPTNDHYHELSSADLANILRELPTRPLLAGKDEVRLSLAGVQDKLAVYVKDNKIFLPLNNAPSTHILKPDFSLFEGIIFNEAICMSLAKQIGLSVAAVEVKKIEDIDYLLVQRYDRTFRSNNTIERLHQEDFCQALGIMSINKYQNEGGPSFVQCFDLLRRFSTTPAIDLNNMINAVIFNFLIGNCDAHGKNFSLLYNNAVHLTPLYDLISTTYYPELSKKMAMKLGGEYQLNKIYLHHFEKLAEDIHFSKPEMRRRLMSMIDAILSALSQVQIEHSIQDEILKSIKNRCMDFAKQFKA